MSPVKQIDLRVVIDAFERRLNAIALKHYWREEKNTVTNQVDCKGCEINYVGLAKAQVMSAMEGVPLIEDRTFKHRAYRRMMRWELVTKECKFRCTLYIFKDQDGTLRQNFIFTSIFDPS